MLTDKNLLVARPHPSAHVGGMQYIYRFKNGMGLSAINSPMLHHYPFAWEIAVLNGVKENGDCDDLNYDSGLTRDVEVFFNDDDANKFIAKAARKFNRKGAKS